MIFDYVSEFEEKDFNCTKCNGLITFDSASLNQIDYANEHGYIFCVECEKHLNENLHAKQLYFISNKKSLGAKQ
tara:strand:+ start:60 stop:281 length:222 start_codon:yes stop_codon:yes gene_type:complete